MPPDTELQALETEVARLVRELELAEAYEQKLRQLVVNVREQIAGGHTQQALSMLNDALREIDAQTDVVVPHREP